MYTQLLLRITVLLLDLSMDDVSELLCLDILLLEGPDSVELCFDNPFLKQSILALAKLYNVNQNL